MRILICMKQVPDTTKVNLTPDMTLEREFVAQIMNPADESALELGLRLRDQLGGSVCVMTMGPKRTESMLREALSRGADEAVQMTHPRFAGADTLVTAQCLAAAIKKLGPFDLILCGRRAVDGETGQVGPMVASMLQYPCIPNIIRAEAGKGEIGAVQLTEAGEITWKSPLPALCTLCEWSYRLRLPTISNLKKSRKAEILLLTPEALSLESCGLKASPTRVTKISSAPTGVRPCEKLPLKTVLARLDERGLLP